jgi:hypothetical protein
MPYELTLSGGLLRFTLSGIVTLEDLLNAAREAQVIEATEPVTPHRLTLLTGVGDFNLSFAKMDEFATIRRTAVLQNKVRSAIVAASQVQLGFARMFQTLNDNPQIEIQIFPDEPAALAWLEEGPAGA